MRAKLNIKYHWRRNDGKKIRKKHREALKESAEERIADQMRDGIREGQLFDNIIIDKKDEKKDGVGYTGYWKVKRDTIYREELDQAETLKEELREHLDAMRSLVSNMPYKGDKKADSQQVCLQVAMNALEHNIDGISKSDFDYVMAS